jgi:hypothetical protein
MKKRMKGKHEVHKVPMKRCLIEEKTTVEL